MEKQENKRVPLMNLDFPYVEGGGEEERRGKGRKTQELETCLLLPGSVLKGIKTKTTSQE